MRILTITALLLASAATAQEFQPMSGAEIAATLTDQRLTYDDAVQDFFAGGRTLYNAGRDSWGSWEVRGDQYCSLWPPVDRWDCYDMTRAGGAVQFIDGGATSPRGGWRSDLFVSLWPAKLIRDLCSGRHVVRRSRN